MSFVAVLRSEVEIYRAVERLVAENLVLFRRWGYAPDVFQAHIIYRTEESGLNVYADVEDVLERGIADCEDLSAWLIAQLRYEGFNAKPLLLRQNARLYHIAAQVFINREWVPVDPSKFKGMRV